MSLINNLDINEAEPQNNTEALHYKKANLYLTTY